MKFSELEQLYRDYKVVGDVVIDQENHVVSDRKIRNDVLFSHLWASSAMTKDRKPFNIDSERTYHYFNERVMEQMKQDNQWNLLGLKIGASYLIPKKSYSREIINGIFFQKEAIQIVDQYIHDNYPVRNSKIGKWKELKPTIRQITHSKFSFYDMMEYHDKYEINKGQFKNKTTGSIVEDDIKKVRISFSYLWHSAANTRESLVADKEYYIYCANAKDIYDAIQENLATGCDTEGQFELSSFLLTIQNTIDGYPEGEKIITNLFGKNPELTYDYFSLLNPSLKDVKKFSTNLVGYDMLKKTHVKVKK